MKKKLTALLSIITLCLQAASLFLPSISVAATGGEKMLICTSEGVRWIAVGDENLPVPPGKKHCPLCYLEDKQPLLSPDHAVEDIVFTASNIRYHLRYQLYHQLYQQQSFLSRGPPGAHEV